MILEKGSWVPKKFLLNVPGFLKRFLVSDNAPDCLKRFLKKFEFLKVPKNWRS